MNNDKQILPICKTCGEEIVITEECEEIKGVAIDYQVERGHLNTCVDKNREKVIGGVNDGE